ncbi:HNH endonuclease signature motif containing protein [Deinococcus sp. LM3]|uniref:HNH endonuclease signature motif containing protein n=1 Tax=Deinococcus sp. LM3 TaxID=1938608 RepID=UPI0009D136F9|nr:HNH endonuclease signature motif containing protein [Deinococcus sp. LM3]OOV12064.1 hypothetical protein BXU09_18735 [Deinococcus sp. LM3]
MPDGRELLGTLLRHEAKTNTYKFALVRALNDLAMEHPFLPDRDVIVPLRRVAQRWLVSYWPFVGEREVMQGSRPVRDGVRRQDLSFRPALTQLRRTWEDLPYTRSHPADGALLLAAYRADRGELSPELLALTRQTLTVIAHAVRQPVRYAGPGGAHGLFGVPAPVASLSGTPLPGSSPHEPAFVVPAALWQALLDLSLWVEALCLQQWSLFVERVEQTPRVTRGEVFTLLTETPEGRVPLTWERNQVRLLMLEGRPFTCPWTARPLSTEAFDLDHLIPVSVHPINELWNLVPSDPQHNMHVKRARIPASARLQEAVPILARTYAAYGGSSGLSGSLQRDVQGRFGRTLPAPELAAEVVRLGETVAQARNVPRY